MNVAFAKFVMKLEEKEACRLAVPTCTHTPSRLYIKYLILNLFSTIFLSVTLMR